MEELPDKEEIIAGFRNNDPRCVEKLYDHFFTELLYYAQKITGNEQEAEDIASRSFAKLCAKHKEFDNFTNIKAFLLIVTRNDSIDYLRRKKRQSGLEKEYIHKLEDREYHQADLIETNTISNLHDAIEKLPLKCKEIFKDLFFNHLSIKEVAQKFRITESTVRTQKGRALKALREKFKQKR